MAREILFKAKRIDNGEWVEGLVAQPLWTDSENVVQTYYFYELKDGGSYRRVVDGNTLCQYTGLTDKNGNKIWENDVVKNLDDEEICKCIWDSCNLEYILDNEFVQYGLGYCISPELEVLGNCFDNPELLGGGE